MDFCLMPISQHLTFELWNLFCQAPTQNAIKINNSSKFHFIWRRSETSKYTHETKIRKSDHSLSLPLSHSNLRPTLRELRFSVILSELGKGPLLPNFG
jgi:hypothetical protein